MRSVGSHSTSGKEKERIRKGQGKVNGKLFMGTESMSLNNWRLR
jgi:hypothetical protein